MIVSKKVSNGNGGSRGNKGKSKDVRLNTYGQHGHASN